MARQDKVKDAMAQQYMALVGYDPFLDDPTISKIDVQINLIQLQIHHAWPDLSDDPESAPFEILQSLQSLQKMLES